jgi:hypothetical protein
MLEADLVFACLLILLGAMLSYLADEYLSLTPRLNAWLENLWD